MGRVFHDREAMLPGQRHDLVHLAGLPSDMNRHHGLHLVPVLALELDNPLFELRNVDIEGRRVRIDKDRVRPR